MSDEDQEHAMIVEFVLPSIEPPDWDALYRLEDELNAVVARTGSGEFDGSEIGRDGSVTLYLYGPDAKTLFSDTSTVLENSRLVSSGSVTLRYGPPDDSTPQETLSLS